MKKSHIDANKDGLIAILKEKSDLVILQNQGWYRIPVETSPKRWPPKWIGFYQPKNFGEDAYRIRYYGQIEDIHIAKRYEIFPNEIPSIRSDREYFILTLKNSRSLRTQFPVIAPGDKLLFQPPGKNSKRLTRLTTCLMTAH